MELRVECARSRAGEQRQASVARLPSGELIHAELADSQLADRLVILARGLEGEMRPILAPSADHRERIGGKLDIDRDASRLRFGAIEAIISTGGASLAGVIVTDRRSPRRL